jgi:hypothetical protein
MRSKSRARKAIAIIVHALSGGSARRQVRGRNLLVNRAYVTLSAGGLEGWRAGGLEGWREMGSNLQIGSGLKASLALREGGISARFPPALYALLQAGRVAG